MGLIDIFFIGVGLSMDAFAVSICKGLRMSTAELKKGALIAFFFGMFQALMPLAGYLLSVKFLSYINRYSHWIAFFLLAAIGGNMILESVKNKEKVDECYTSVVNFKELTLLAVATSIDALAVGVSFGTMGNKLQLPILEDVLIIGITTFVISFMGVLIGSAFGTKWKSKAEILGGVILIFIGVKVLLEHYL